MTSITHIKSPSADDAKDPNDSRNDASYRGRVEEAIASAESINLIDFKPTTIEHGFLNSIASIPQRKFIVDGMLLRGYLSAVLAPGGVGKSVFAIALGISVASGQPILGLEVLERTNVLILNNEDDTDEMKRRIAAIMQQHGISGEQLAGRLFYKSGYGSPDVFARKVARMFDGYTGTVIEATERAVDLIRFCKEHDIGAIFCDPLVSLHDASENDNGEMERAIGVLKSICYETNAAMFISHHIPKGGADSESHAGNADASRGAGAVKDGCRIVMTLARMSKQSGENLGLDIHEYPRMIRLDDAKKNYSLVDAEATWFRMGSVKLANGDWVGVPEAKNIKPLFETMSATGQKKKWTPTSVAEALERIMIGKSECKWTDIKARFMNDNDVKESVASLHLPLVSQDKDEPTHIKTKSGFDVHYWIKRGARNSWIIHRLELN